MPDEDHQTVLPKNFQPGQFDADGHIERERQLQHKHDPTNVDPTEDPSAAAATAVTSGPIQDAKTELLVGPHDPGSPTSQDFGSGAGALPNQGTIPTDPNHGLATDPSPLADTTPQTSGPSERTHQNPTPDLQAGSAHTHAGSGQQSSNTADGHDGGANHSSGEPVLSNPRIPHLEFPDHASAPGSGSHVVPKPAVADAHHPVVPPPEASGAGAHDPTGQHPILPDPAVPEAHHVEVPPPHDGGEASLDPGSHHPIPEPETHHLDPHFPG
jgi:hypothetical protein